MNIADTRETSKSDEAKKTEGSKHQEGDEAAEDDASLVLLQFSDLDDATYCEQFSNKFKSINIESKHPIIQIGNRLYSGEYINNIGTYLFFEDKSQHQHQQQPPTQEEYTATTTTTTASNQQQTQDFDYSGKSFKKLVLTRLFVEEATTQAGGNTK
jgi:hypothetical protein